MKERGNGAQRTDGGKLRRSQHASRLVGNCKARWKGKPTVRCQPADAKCGRSVRFDRLKRVDVVRVQLVFSFSTSRLVSFRLVFIRFCSPCLCFNLISIRLVWLLFVSIRLVLSHLISFHLVSSRAVSSRSVSSRLVSSHFVSFSLSLSLVSSYFASLYSALFVFLHLHSWRNIK